ncbi:TetR/AcrR family transcriptional regulator [Plantactinospora soyae]|uniref:AcrR family transcriptional regulator n=1 Tax=Plantactinospora soyae TaxID=1544732 RepID=A0A927MAU7_9ACTN|nr:TetR/AcrR family transcriptional regulator [Plantactinospora soyae]MBE1491094.1 AcrR family transcriptional regulator [Plantactinospora soyae]
MSTGSGTPAAGSRNPAAEPAGPALSGRRAQAARNDQVILAAAREVFLADPKAPIGAVAERAGVGISALYRRYPGKEDLLRQLCHDGLRHYVATARQAAEKPDGWQALVTFLDELVAADVHSLTVRLAGTFTPTAEMGADAVLANELAAALVDRAHASGRLRPDVVVADVAFILEACAAIRLPDPIRTDELRRRYLALLVDGMRDGDGPTLPGPAPAGDEMTWRWRRTGSGADTPPPGN